VYAGSVEVTTPFSFTSVISSIVIWLSWLSIRRRTYLWWASSGTWSCNSTHFSEFHQPLGVEVRRVLVGAFLTSVLKFTLRNNGKGGTRSARALIQAVRRHSHFSQLMLHCPLVYPHL
jgi:hypothetical protein